MGYVFDDTTLLVDGKLRVADITNGMDTIISPEALVDIYTMSGIRVVFQQPYAKVRELLTSGTYIMVKDSSFAS